MFSYVSSIFNYFFNKITDQEDDYKENFLAEQLLDLEIVNDQNENNIQTAESGITENNCFQKTGLISYIDKSNNYVLIDGMLYFELSTCSLNLNVNDKVLYLAFKDTNESIVVVRILENYGKTWGDEESNEESKFKVIEHTFIGEVEERQDRFVYMKDRDLKFNLDNVEATFIPVKGDWLELKCNVQWDEDKPSDISLKQILQVVSFKPLRSKVKSATITDWTGDCGVCDRIIYFHKNILQNGIAPELGSKVLVEAIESSQGRHTWRAIKFITIESDVIDRTTSNTLNEEERSLELEKKINIDMNYPLKFDNIHFNESAKIPLNITNNSGKVQTITKWVLLSKKRDSQVNIKPFLSEPVNLLPKSTFRFTITCHPKFLGHTKECLVIIFRGFQFKRFININIINNDCLNYNVNVTDKAYKREDDNITNMKKLRSNGNKTLVPGIKPVKPPAFVPVRLGSFPIPEKIWSTVLGDSNQTMYSSDYDKILARIESNLPCLIQELNIANYIDKWHTLLYMEEIQTNISMRSYDMPKAFLTSFQDYLGIEVNGLMERRPSLIKGDRVILKDIWDASSPQYEGYIHIIKGNLVLMKFNPQFHESYSGSDVSIEFHSNRSGYRRCHQAINLALSNLGPDVLLPSRVLSHMPQVPVDKLKIIKWYNGNLNSGQKAAVTNILLGECRPMPYCIYGPPGTGKTVTVIETILQILTLLPDSRILVATPSNSASNLITERLIQYRNLFSDSIIRLIANYLLDSDTIPDKIKPYCATLDITREDTAKCKYDVTKDGINLNCRTLFIGRHRVTIGTCICLGMLAQMGLPRGHFTHVIIDEAGQATEPEIMIPMTFIDKENGQVILAGDPMQLGPIVMSKYCREFEMDVSYLCRILETFPYQKDYDAYKDGYNKKLVTKLNDNYRSLVEVLKLPSEMFYDGSLVAKIDKNQSWILSNIDVTSEIFELGENKSGGIFVFGIRGTNMRAEDNPSWYNPEEASMVALTTCKFYKKNITEDQIGIITPYIAQVKYLRLLFDAMGLPQPKIGSVEEFQGQERPIVFISTVRSMETYLQEDQKHSLGFVKNPKRLNVALTRAQVTAIIFCNPHLLCKDRLWNKVISHAVKENKYKGCDLPHICDNL